MTATRAATPSFAGRVIAWQRTHGRHDLPWQGTGDAYRVWLSEVMLQQTQVATVIPYFERFVAAFPDVRALAAAPIDRVLELWSGLGYYCRAHHLHAAAQRVVAEHGGAFPRDAQALASLPGVGRSTAAAIAALAYGARTAILDGNVKRVLARHHGVDGYPGAPKVETALWTIAESRLPQGDTATYTQGLMDLGATVCTRSAPRCDACPVRGDCVALREARVATLPSPRPKRALPQRAVRLLLFERGGAILLEKRPPLGIWGGLWSLPELALDDDPRTFARTRYGVDAEPGATLAPIEHGFTHFALTLHPQRMRVDAWPPSADAPDRAWLVRDDALGAALPAPIRKLLRAL